MKTPVCSIILFRRAFTQNCKTKRNLSQMTSLCKRIKRRQSWRETPGKDLKVQKILKWSKAFPREKNIWCHMALTQQHLAAGFRYSHVQTVTLRSARSKVTAESQHGDCLVWTVLLILFILFTSIHFIRFRDMPRFICYHKMGISPSWFDYK